MIVVEGLTFGYASQRPIVQGLSTRLRHGTMTAVVGRSGSGKSTLLYLLGLLVTPSHGRIVIEGQDVVGLADWRRAELRARRMAFVFQDSLLDPARSVLDNVTEGGLYSRMDRAHVQRRALALLEEFQVSVDPERRPGQISGGQAQRVALCRAFVRDPRIVLADEPTGNLDEETTETVWRALRARAGQGAVVVVATHDRARAALCDDVVDIGDGAFR